jgi:hypothetical protein
VRNPTLLPYALVWFVSSALIAVSDPARAEPPPPVEPGPAAWGFEGPYRFEVGVRAGLAQRVDDPPLFEASNSSGLVGGLGIGLEASRHVAFGLAYEHLGLWREQTKVLENGTFRVARRTDTLWLAARLYPLRLDTVGVFVDVSVGPSWQGVSLSGSAWSAITPGERVPVSCRGSGSTGFALRGRAGIEVAVSERLVARIAPNIDTYRHSDELVGNCAPGAGTTTVVGLLLEFAYGWPL